MFFRKQTADLPPVSLADEAVASVGQHDAHRAKSIERLRQIRARLDSTIRRELDALAAVEEAIKREERADMALSPQAEIAAAESLIECAIEEISLHDQVADETEKYLEDRDPEYDAADDGRKSYEAAVEAKRKRGDKHWPKRASEKQLAAAE